jgi:hypothetical protein
MSYKQFSNLVSKKNQIYETMVKINGKDDPLRKTLLIIDEAHKLYGGGDLSSIETPDMVSLHASLMNSYVMSGDNSVKLLLMTATPIQTDPMELIKLVNLFKMPDAQMPNTFEIFSQKYLNDEGFFTADGLHHFRNDIAGHISYLNREKDARQFSQPVISMIYTNVYDKALLKYNKTATRKIYSGVKKSIQDKLKTLKQNPVIKQKSPEGYESLKKICESYEYPKARNACKKVVNSYKKSGIAKLKADKLKAKAEIIAYKEATGNLQAEIKDLITESKDLEVASPLLFRTGKNKTQMKNISSVYERLSSKCSKNQTDNKLVNSAIENNPVIAELTHRIEGYNQNIADNTLVLKKEKNVETKQILKRLIYNNKTRLIRDKKSLKKNIKKYTTLVKKTIKETKKKGKRTENNKKIIIKQLKALKRYAPKMTDKELETQINEDIQKVIEPIELKQRENDEKKHAKTLKKMEREQKKLQKVDAEKAKEHNKTMKKMKDDKAKEDKEFAKMQKIRETEIKKIEAENKKKEKELEKEREKQREKEAKENAILQKKMEKEAEIEANKQKKEQEKERAKAMKEAEIEANKQKKEQEKERAKVMKDAEIQANKQRKEEEKKREKELKKAAKTMKTPKKKTKGGTRKKRK